MSNGMSAAAMRARTLGRLLAASTVFGAPALAQPPQEFPNVPSPLRVETDHNGVNLTTGRTTIDGPVLSVPAAPNLRFDRVQNAAPYAAGNVEGQAGEYPTGNWTVQAGTGASEAFSCSDVQDCGSVTLSGSTFDPPALQGANSIYRQAGTGATWHFNQVSVVAGQFRQAYASTVRYPNGETISYTYDKVSYGPFSQILHRPRRIESNRGYHIALTYQSDDIETAYWGTVAQATLYRNAEPATPLARLSYAGGIVTDLGGRHYACASCGGTLGQPTETVSGSLQLPGESAPALTVAAVPGKQLVQSVTRDGVPWTYAFSYQGGQPYLHAPSNSYWYDRLVVTGPNGVTQVYTFEISGQRVALTGSTDPIGRTTDYDFDSAYRPVRIDYPEENAVSVLYDGSGNVVSRTMHARSDTIAAITETADYPGPPQNMPNLCHVRCWRPTARRDALGRQTDYLYNDGGQLTRQTEPADSDGIRRRTTIDYALSPAQISRPVRVSVCGLGPVPDTGLSNCGTSREIVTEYEYVGDTGLVALERRRDLASGTVLDTRHDYDPAGRLLSTDGPLPGTDDKLFYRYDVHGRRTWEIGGRAPNGVRIATRHTYRDSDDKVTVSETGTLPDETGTVLSVFRRTERAYDPRRNPARETVREAAGGGARGVTDFAHDLLGRLECTAIRMNPAAWGSEPAPGCLLNSAGAHGPDRVSRNVYDAAGQRLQLRVGVGTAAEAAEATWAYNLNGQVTAVIDGNGNRATLAYDGHMRQVRWTFPSAAAPGTRPPYDDTTPASAIATAGAVDPDDYEAYTYDAAGNRLSLRKRDGRTLGYQYDNLDRMILKTVPERPDLAATHTRDVHYRYDLRNLPLFARFDSVSGEGVTNAYDPFGRLASASIDMGGVTRTLAYQYDAAGNRTRITHPDGPYFSNHYEGVGRFSYTLENGGTTLFSQGYADQGFVNVVYRPGGGSGGWNRDGLGRLLYQSHWLTGGLRDLLATFTHNPAGQLASETRDNDAYAWTGHHGANRTYAADGLNRYSAVGPPGGPPEAVFGYDANGNLTSDGTDTYQYDIENRLVGRSGTVTLTYDPLGRLFQLTSGASTTQFLYDGDALIAEYNAAGAVAQRYVHGPGTDNPVAWYEGSAVGAASRNMLLADERGSIIAITNGASALRYRNAYDEYGTPGSGNQGRFQYTGQIWLSEIGLYHYKARVYSPRWGRFLQTDPVGYEDQFNLYAYVGNDPVNRVDPDGRQTIQDMQLEMHIEDMRQQGMSEQEIHEQIGWEARLQAEALLIFTGVGEGISLATWGYRAFQGWRAFVAANRAVQGGRLVLYSGEVPANLARGEVAINMRTGWSLARNDRLIADAIRQGRPIRDSYVTRTGALRPARPGSVLERERNQLSRAGWRYDGRTQEWKPRNLCIRSRIPTSSTC